MSDFDKEAERERLREKYEKDKKEREATERMSELLLQGATMTNAHCSECGDPIFRYDGQEFCATCERPVDRDGGDETEHAADTGIDGQNDEAADVEVTSPREDSRVVFGGEQRDNPETDERKGTQNTQPDAAGDRQRRRIDPEPAGDSGEQRSDRAGRNTRPATSQHGGDSTGGVEAARASLVRTLAAFSRRAEATDNPQRAREHLQAAREAAETLATLRE